MIQSLLSVFAPMLLGAQIILTLVLVRGEICPGQRGRIHRLLPAIGVLWLAVASLKIEAFMVVFAIFYFYSQVQTKKTRDEGPLWVLYLANGLSLAYVAILVSEQANWPASVANVILVGLLGSCFSHLLLTIARTRLQAFHRLLPIIGILCAMGVALCVVPKAYGLDDQALTQATLALLTSFGLMIAGIIAWCWHILFSKNAEKIQLGIALLFMLAASTSFQGLFIL
ncbi:hypothetical protein [Vibrio aestuarianus]|uniref:hypothetical protein n=1 Tax=Vibrio aestuarianus TaxID=28171 RepID=UPI0021C4794D|nr:hypothetical protein [Vibrio aestuarianus]MDE1208566.1 hypothetical protein [Vibrio aestuarianus]MDE1254504.1 hypothetical protein [Vibrio aestuarianus]MDE1317371.1 hypothetical protein [Vibrio aestuarianus]CAH8205771.1 Membrane protein [Vibrio aestuarianus]